MPTSGLVDDRRQRVLGSGSGTSIRNSRRAVSDGHHHLDPVRLDETGELLVVPRIHRSSAGALHEQVQPLGVNLRALAVGRECLSQWATAISSQPLQRFSHVCRRRASARRSAGLKAGRYTDVKRALKSSRDEVLNWL